MLYVVSAAERARPGLSLPAEEAHFLVQFAAREIGEEDETTGDRGSHTPAVEIGALEDGRTGGFLVWRGLIGFWRCIQPSYRVWA